MKHLDNKTLLLDIKNLVKKEKQTTAQILEYLSEIDRRRLWQPEGYSSLHDFCIRYLNYSEGESNRRIQAARITQEVQELKPLLENNELSLTAVSTVAPHINRQNAASIIPKITNQPIRVIERVLRENFPEAAKKPEILEIRLDEELKGLLEAAKRVALEKDPALLLKKVLVAYTKREKKKTEAAIEKKSDNHAGHTSALVKDLARTSEGAGNTGNTKSSRALPKKHTRYIPAQLRRDLFQRGYYQCEYTSPSGVRCNQTEHLQTDHIQPWAMGGSSWDRENLRLLCRTHNLYKAGVDFPKTTPNKARRNFPQTTPGPNPMLDSRTLLVRTDSLKSSNEKTK